MIILSSYEVIKEAFLQRGDDFAGLHIDGAEFADFDDSEYFFFYFIKLIEIKI